MTAPLQSGKAEKVEGMKTYAYYDSGTTNSRLYLIREGAIAAVLTEKVGTVDNVLSGDKSTLERALFQMYRRLLTENHLTDGDIDEIYMSGMATSKNGICEVDYARLPLGISDYRRTVSFKRSGIFGREIGYFTGVVSRPETEGTIDDIFDFNNVRGEEIELFGIMEREKQWFEGQRTAVIMPGSHTHVLFTDNGRITRILSCMGGELFAAVSRHTILNASVSENPEHMDEKTEYALIKGYEAVKQYGFNRATYMVRALDLFSDASQGERDFFYEGVINGGIVTGIESCREFAAADRICVAGKRVYFDIFDAIVRHEKWKIPCSYVEPGTESFALRGFLELMRLD